MVLVFLVRSDGKFAAPVIALLNWVPHVVPPLGLVALFCAVPFKTKEQTRTGIVALLGIPASGYAVQFAGSVATIFPLR